MSLVTNQSILKGQFTSDGSSQTLDLPWEPSKIELLNITQFGSTAGASPVITAFWETGMASNSVVTGLKTNGAATIEIPAMNTSQGVRVVDSSDQTPGAPVTGTAISKANGAVVDMVAHGFLVGDVVRLYNTTGMLQIAGMEFTVTAVGDSDHFTLGTLDSSGFASAATAVTARNIPWSIYFPRYNWITNISKATSAVIQCSMLGPGGFEVGQVVSLKVPSAFGMTEADGKNVAVTAVDNSAGTITVDLDTTSFTTFSFPTSATAAAGVDFPLVVPFGNNQGSPINPLYNQAPYQVFLGTNAIGGNNDVMQWIATRAL
jgi:hypothetical protein